MWGGGWWWGGGGRQRVVGVLGWIEMIVVGGQMVLVVEEFGEANFHSFFIFGFLFGVGRVVVG